MMIRFWEWAGNFFPLANFLLLAYIPYRVSREERGGKG